VSDILQTSPELVAAALAADNVVVALYFAFLFYISRPGEDTVDKSGTSSFSGSSVNGSENSGGAIIEAAIDSSSTSNNEDKTAAPDSRIVLIPAGDRVITDLPTRNNVNLNSLSIAISLALAICAVSNVLGSLLFTSPILLSSLIAIALATAYPITMSSFSEAGGIIGVLFMQV
jgi:hypothetical protein